MLILASETAPLTVKSIVAKRLKEDSGQCVLLEGAQHLSDSVSALK